MFDSAYFQIEGFKLNFLDIWEIHQNIIKNDSNKDLNYIGKGEPSKRIIKRFEIHNSSPLCR